MAKIDTKGKDQIAGGVVYRAGKDGMVEVPDEIAESENLTIVPSFKPKRSYTKKEE